MMIVRAFVLLILVASHWGASATEQPKNVRSGPYVFCNVFASDACFGIAQGDKLSMEIVIDFVLYHISFSSGRSATIYSGYHPDLSKSQGKTFEKCGNNSFTECKRRNLDDGGVELLAQRDKQSQFLHVIVSAGAAKDTPLVESFLQNIRSCIRTGDAIRCVP